MAINSVNRILLRSPNWLGDVILSFPVARALKQIYPQAEITVVAKNSISDIWETRPEISRIVIAPRHHSLSALSSWGNELKNDKYDLGILLTNSLSTALEMKYAGVSELIGYAYGFRNHLLTYPVAPPDKVPRMVDYYLHLLEPLAEGNTFNGIPDFYVSEKARQSVQELLVKEGISTGNLLIGMNPGAAYGGAKCWPSHRFTELGKQLADKYKAKILLFGAPGDKQFLEGLAHKIGPNAVNMAGKTNLIQLAACLKQCNLFITNDSGPMHLAAALETPLLAFFGPTDWESTSPVGKGKIKVLRHPVDCSPCLMRECPRNHECMSLISVEEAFSSAVTLLN
jgi:heptosyltransferase-2